MNPLRTIAGTEYAALMRTAASPPLVGLVVLSSLCSGCAATQQMVMLPPAPSSEAPLVERDRYYEDKKPIGIAGIPNAVNQLGWLAPATFPILVLADGTKVADPMSLLPAVDGDSRTAEAARRVGDLKLFTNAVYTVSTLGLTVGLTALLTAPLFLGGGIDPAGAASFSLLGLGGTVVGALGIGWAAQLAEEAEAEKFTALLMYETDLRKRLNLVRPDEVLEKKWVQPAAVKVAPPTPQTPQTPTPEPTPDPSDPSEPPALLQ